MLTTGIARSVPQLCEQCGFDSFLKLTTFENLLELNPYPDGVRCGQCLTLYIRTPGTTYFVRGSTGAAIPHEEVDEL